MYSVCNGLSDDMNANLEQAIKAEMKNHHDKDKNRNHKKLNSIITKGICKTLQDFNAETKCIVTRIQVDVNYHNIKNDNTKDITMHVDITVSTDIEEINTDFDNQE